MKNGLVSNFTRSHFSVSKTEWDLGTRLGIPFIDIYRRAENGAEQLVRNNEGQGSWIGNEVEDVGVDKIYLDSAVIVHLR